MAASMRIADEEIRNASSRLLCGSCNLCFRYTLRSLLPNFCACGCSASDPKSVLVHLTAFLAGGVLANSFFTIVALLCLTVAGLVTCFNHSNDDIFSTCGRCLNDLGSRRQPSTVLRAVAACNQHHDPHGATSSFRSDVVEVVYGYHNVLVLSQQRLLFSAIQHLLPPGLTAEQREGANEPANECSTPVSLNCAAERSSSRLSSSKSNGSLPRPASGSFESDDFLSVSSASVSPEPQLSIHQINPRSSDSGRMSEYVIPVDANREMLKKMIQETEEKLTNQRALIDQADDAAILGLERKERRLAEFLQRLETRLSTMTCEGIEGTVVKNREDINGLRLTSDRQGVELKRVVDRVTFLEAFCMQLRDQVDRVDNAQRRQNDLVYGFETAEPWSIAQNLFQDKPEFVPEVDDVFFLGKGKDKKFPLKIQFKCLTAAREFLTWSSSNEFRSKFPFVGAGRDQTTLRRVGTSRLAAAAEALRVAFPGAHIPPASGFVKYKTRKYDALEFAAAAIVIDGVVFDIDKACHEAPDRVENQSLSVQQGNIVTRGFKAKNGRGRGRGGESQGLNRGGRGGGSQRGHSQRGGAGPSNHGNFSNTAPRFNGFTTGGVAVAVGSDKTYGDGRLDVAGSLPNRFNVRV